MQINQNVTQMENSSQADESTSYRMVQKKFFCYVCEKTYKKMMSVDDFKMNGIVCDCGSEFCEAITAGSGNQFLGQESSEGSTSRDGSNSSRRQENLRDVSPQSDLYGRPVSSRQRIEEAKLDNGPRANMPQATQSSQTNQSQGSRVRVINPFESMFQMDSLFNDIGFMGQSQFGTGYNQNFRSTHQSSINGPSGPVTQTITVSFGNGGPSLSHGSIGLEDFGFQSFADLINRQMGMQQQDGATPTSDRVINRLPVEKIEEKHCKKDCKGKLEQPTCSVCISDFDMGQEAMILPCGHAFHPNCIKPWLSKNDKCPVCRKELPKE